MKKKLSKKAAVQKRRTQRIRKNINGSAAKPRLCVVKTNKNIYAQLIDDLEGKVLFATSTISKEFKATEKKDKASATKLGARLGLFLKEQNIEKIVFDRGRFKYHGILAHLADAVRKEGINF